MKSIYVIAKETFVLLRRDKIFLPLLIFGLCLLYFASMMQDSSSDELVKVMLDMGASGFFITGILVCLLWGIKSICESRKDGSIELQLVSPVTRSQWLIGKYLGLCCSLFMLGVILYVGFQVLLYLDFKRMLTWGQFLIFVYMFIGWLVFAAICTFFASFCNTPSATFSSFCLWILGMLSGLLVNTLPPRNIGTWVETFVKMLATFWNFQRFNLIEYTYYGATFPPASDLMWFALYGLSVIALLLSVAAIIFSKRDLV